RARVAAARWRCLTSFWAMTTSKVLSWNRKHTGAVPAVRRQHRGRWRLEQGIKLMHDSSVDTLRSVRHDLAALWSTIPSSSQTSIDSWLLMGHGVRWDGKALTGFDAANSGDTQSRHCS